MRTFLRHSLAVLFTILCAVWWADPLRAQELSEVKGFLPVAINGATVRLEALLIKRTDAQGRLPVAILTNGGISPTSNINVSPDDYARNARDLARQGWLAVVVMRRGYGRSEGDKPAPLSCQASAFTAWASAAADDLQGVMTLIAQRPDADPARVMVLGPESGGVAAVALSARNPRGLVATVSIAGTVASESGCPMADILTNAYRSFGANNHIPQLWIYAKSDKSAPPDAVEHMHSAYLDGGGDVKFVEFNSWGDTDKGVFGSSRQQWMIQLGGFLQGRSLPTWSQADSDNVLDKLGLKDNPRNVVAYRLSDDYVPWGGESAIAFTPSGQKSNPDRAMLWYSQGATLDGARQAALTQCKAAASDCVIVMENLAFVGPQQ